MTLSWKRKTLEQRARISARKDNAFNKHWPRRFVFFGPRIVPLEVFLLAQARTAQRNAKDRKHFESLTIALRGGSERRQRSLDKAAVYIQDLKDRLAAATYNVEQAHDYSPASARDGHFECICGRDHKAGSGDKPLG